MDNNLNVLYNYYEKQAAKALPKYARRCIDGKVVGCSKCVGYCQYDGHPGFLTDKQRKEHRCLEKECFYYVQKSSTGRCKSQNVQNSTLTQIINSAKKYTAEFAEMKILSAYMDSDDRCVLKYVTISNEYPISKVAATLTAEFELIVQFEKANLDFDTCVDIILGEKLR